jgi:hypothetical protein
MTFRGLGEKFDATTAMTFVIEKLESGKYFVDCTEKGVPSLFVSEDDAEYVMSQMSKPSQNKRTIRIASEQERATGVIVRPRRQPTIKKYGLVEVYEDIRGRKFAISSRAESESEFITEFAASFASLSSVDAEDEATRMRELLPLVVDMCCKYRGYKAERVYQRTLLVAGDLEIPSARLEANITQEEKP